MPGAASDALILCGASELPRPSRARIGVGGSASGGGPTGTLGCWDGWVTCCHCLSTCILDRTRWTVYLWGPPRDLPVPPHHIASVACGTFGVRVTSGAVPHGAPPLHFFQRQQVVGVSGRSWGQGLTGSTASLWWPLIQDGLTGSW